MLLAAILHLLMVYQWTPCCLSVLSSFVVVFLLLLLFFVITESQASKYGLQLALFFPSLIFFFPVWYYFFPAWYSFFILFDDNYIHCNSWLSFRITFTYFCWNLLWPQIFKLTKVTWLFKCSLWFTWFDNIKGLSTNNFCHA